MKCGALLIAAVVSVATLVSSQAEEQGRRRLPQSIPENVIFCGRLDLNVVRKNPEAKTILAAVEKQFKEPLDAIGQFSGLDLYDIDRIWIGVIKDKEALVILEGSFDIELILSSPVVANSRKLIRPGPLVAIEIKDDKNGELSHAVVISKNIVAFGLPQLVDRFSAHFVDSTSGWDENGLTVMDSLAASDAMLYVAAMQIPKKEIKAKPFLANMINARMEMTMEEQVVATATITMQDAEKATGLRDLISGFVTLGLTSEIKVNFPEIKAAILTGLELRNDDRTVVLSSRMDTQLLLNLLGAKGLALD